MQFFHREEEEATYTYKTKLYLEVTCDDFVILYISHIKLS